MNKIKKAINSDKFHKITLLSCFIFSTICFILLISQVYSFVAQELPRIDNSVQENTSNFSKKSPPPKDDFFRGIPKDSPITLFFSFLGFLINLFAGIIIYSNLYVREKKEIKSKVASEMLLPEERLIIKLLEENNGELTQSELVRKSGLNKLKVSRVIKRLENLKIINKYPYGMTNNIKLK